MESGRAAALMKGLILTYLLTAAAVVGGFRHPVFALFVYVGFAVLRPQALFGFAGDLSGLSFWVAMAMLLGWGMHRFGSWQFRRGKIIVTCLLLYAAWHAISCVLALDSARALPQIPVLARFILPLLVGVTMLDDSKLQYWMLWTIVLAQGWSSATAKTGGASVANTVSAVFRTPPPSTDPHLALKAMPWGDVAIVTAYHPSRHWSAVSTPYWKRLETVLQAARAAIVR